MVISRRTDLTLFAPPPPPLSSSLPQKISLSCSIPVNFSYEIKVLQPHPYFRVEPRLGIIPANGSVDVQILFSPMTLGRCTIKLRLLIGQYGFTPLDCEVSAMAVSGLIESREMRRADRRVLDFIVNVGNTLNNVLGNASTFKGNLTAKPGVGTLRGSGSPLDGRAGASLSMSFSQQQQQQQGMPLVLGQMDRFMGTRFLQSSGQRHHKTDPVATMLASTFQSTDLDTALDRVVQDKLLLGTKVLQRSKDGTWQPGVRAVHCMLQSTVPVRPRGPGSGIVFDAGAQWASLQHAQYTKKLKKGKSKGNNADGADGGDDTDADAGTDEEKGGPESQEKVVAGLRIPAMLDSVTSTNFVLTQEAGKLKPKDLKAAIDRNRAEREARAAEQERMREEGGGAGSLDRMGVLAEEKMNVAGDGDPFKRQLRELAFLADVDEVEKQETDKEFRVSEEYLGALLLSDEDVEAIERQRQLMALRKKRADWRVMQSRQHSKLFPPTHPTMKAGAPTAIVMQAVACLTPSFDANRNDIWAKRMNTLRYFVSMVTRWIVRRRVQQRLAVIKARINEVCHDVLHGPLAAFLTEKPKAMLGGATTAAAAEAILAKNKRKLHRAMKDCVRAWINDENSANKMKGGSLAANALAEGGDEPPAVAVVPDADVDADGEEGAEAGGEVQQPFAFEQCATVAELVCASDDAFIVRRHKSETALTGARIEMTSHDTVQRLLFPKCVVEEGNLLLPLAAPAIEAVPPRFDDRAFFPLKVRPEYVSMRYTTHRMPEVPIFFPTGRDKPTRTGAPEEATLRPPADFTATGADLLAIMPPEPPALAALRVAALRPLPDSDSDAATVPPRPSLDEESRDGGGGGDDSAVALALLANGGGVVGQVLPLTAERLLSAPSWLAPTDNELLMGGVSSSGRRGPVWAARDVDFFRPRPDMRMYAAAPALKETDPDWILRPYASVTCPSSSRGAGAAGIDALKYADDGSVRSRWLSAPGFSSAQAYLLGGLESRCTEAGHHPAPGPTLVDSYRPDLDRHHSGLFCFRRDHLRSLTATDLDYGPLQQRQDRGDHLTDSESDDEDKYVAPKPTLKRVRALLSGAAAATGAAARPISAAKGKAASPGKDAVVAAAAAAVTNPGADGGGGGDDDVDPRAVAAAEQVELLRDRKVLEMEGALLKARNERSAAVSDRLAALSKASKCLLQALAVQLPMHLHAAARREHLDSKLAPVLTTYIQPAAEKSADRL